MRNAFTVFLVSAILLVCASAAIAQSNPPVNNVYETQNGDFLEGRYSISWASPDGYQNVGNVAHLESWDGANLGNQWRIFCPIIASAVQTYHVDLPFPPNTYIEGYLIQYVGGTVWLDGAGPWGGGDPSYTAMIDTYTEARGIQVTAGVLTGLNTTQSSTTAQVVGYPMSCLVFDTSNTAWIGDTDQNGAKPGDYPAFLDGNCDPTRTMGHWGTRTDITLTVQGCFVGTEDTSWGAVKARYTK